jgi:hypothetical protein
MSKPIVERVAQLLGVDPRSDRKTFKAALDRELALRDQTDPQAVAQLHTDERLLDQAMKDGKIIAASRPHWLKALREDRDGAKRMIAVLASVPEVVRANLDGSSRTAAVREIAAQTPGDAFEPTVTTADEMNAAIEADPEMHRAVWAISRGGGGLKPPPERFTAVPDADVPWDPAPRLVTNDDGTGSHWETPEVDEKWLTTQGPRREPRTGSRTK